MSLLMLDENDKYVIDCPLCGETLDDPLFSTSHFIGDESHKLWQYSEAAMHYRCYVEWEHQAEFAQMYFEARTVMVRQSEYREIAYLDDLVLVTVNPTVFVAEAYVHLARSGLGYSIDLEDWEDWLRNKWSEKCIDEFDRGALLEVMPTLRSVVPTVRRLFDAAGIDGQSRRPGPGGLVARLLRKGAIRKLAHRANTTGIDCPHCGHFSTSYEYQEVESTAEGGPQSTLTCNHCGKDFGPEDRTIPL